MLITFSKGMDCLLEFVFFSTLPSSKIVINLPRTCTLKENHIGSVVSEILGTNILLLLYKDMLIFYIYTYKSFLMSLKGSIFCKVGNMIKNVINTNYESIWIEFMISYNIFRLHVTDNLLFLNHNKL